MKKHSPPLNVYVFTLCFMSLIKRTIVLLFLISSHFYYGATLNAQCPTTSCTNKTSLISTANLPICGVGTTTQSGNIDNNSDCSIVDPNNSNKDLNCWKFVLTRHDPTITGITADIGKGAGCSGEISQFYTSINGVCTSNGSSGSQNAFTFDFEADGVINIWVCDGSSGQVSMCFLCAESNIPTPVDLVDFTGHPKETAVELNWQTASEENNAGFQIEHSTDGKDWESIGMQKGNGTTDVFQSYTYVDQRPAPGNNYYRLKQIDFDGQFEYSKTVSVSIERTENSLLEIFPNPSTGPFKFGFHNPGLRKANAKLFDSTGSLIWSKHFPEEKALSYWEKEFDLPQQEVYFVMIQIGDVVETKKVSIISSK